MKVLLTAAGSRGDVQPLAVLGAALQRRGHDVVLVASPDQAPVGAALGVPFVPCGRDILAWLASRPQDTLWTLPATLRELRGWFEHELAAWMPTLIEAGRGADVVVGAGLQPLVKTIAEVHGAVGLYTSYAPGLLWSRADTPIVSPVQGLPGPINLVLHALMEAAFGRVVPFVNVERARLGLAPHRHFLDALPDDAMLAWDDAIAPIPADTVDHARGRGVNLRIWPVGALLMEAGPLDDDVAAFVAGGPCVYVGFGSMPDHNADEVCALVRQATATAGVRAVLLGPGPRRLVDHVLVVPHVDHRALFPRVAAVVHHGGAGTTACAARAGVPQVVVPHFFDQPGWGARLARLGVAAAVIPRPRLTADRLATALLRARGDVALQAAARTLADRLRPTDPVAAAVEVVEELHRRRSRDATSVNVADAADVADVADVAPGRRRRAAGRPA